MINRVVHLINWNRRDSDDMVITGNLHPKIFRSSYLIALHTGDVMEQMDDLATAVVEASKQLLPVFEAVVRMLAVRKTWKEVMADPTASSIAPVTCRYIRTFLDWKKNDEARLGNKIKASLRNLARSLRSMASSGEKHKDIRKKLEDQTGRLKQKLCIIQGKDELKRYEEEEAETARAAEERVAKRARQAVGDAEMNESMLSSSFRGMSNAHVAHEILLNPMFELDDDVGEKNRPRDEKLVSIKLRRSLSPAFWEELTKDLVEQRDPSHARVLQVLSIRRWHE